MARTLKTIKVVLRRRQASTFEERAQRRLGVYGAKLAVFECVRDAESPVTRREIFNFAAERQVPGELADRALSWWITAGHLSETADGRYGVTGGAR